MVEVENFDFSDVTRYFFFNLQKKNLLKFNLKPKPNEKEWILVCSRCDYMEMAKILSKTPNLAQKRDPFNGFTVDFKEK